MTCINTYKPPPPTLPPPHQNGMWGVPISQEDGEGHWETPAGGYLPGKPPSHTHLCATSQLTNPLPHSKCKMEGGFCSFLWQHPPPSLQMQDGGGLCYFLWQHPPSSLQCKMEGSLLCFQHHPACKPLLAEGDGGADQEEWQWGNDRQPHQPWWQQWWHGTTAMSTVLAFFYMTIATSPPLLLQTWAGGSWSFLCDYSYLLHSVPHTSDSPIPNPKIHNKHLNMLSPTSHLIISLFEITPYYRSEHFPKYPKHFPCLMYLN